METCITKGRIYYLETDTLLYDVGRAAEEKSNKRLQKSRNQGLAAKPANDYPCAGLLSEEKPPIRLLLYLLTDQSLFVSCKGMTAAWISSK